LAEIATIAAANRYLAEQFMPDYNARFAVPAAEVGSALLAYAGQRLDEVLCIQQEGQVGRDNCVRWKVSPCRSRRNRTATTTSRRRCACTNTRVDAWPSLMDPSACAVSIAMASRQCRAAA
jgi:hypothetical protein